MINKALFLFYNIISFNFGVKCTDIEFYINLMYACFLKTQVIFHNRMSFDVLLKVGFCFFVWVETRFRFILLFWCVCDVFKYALACLDTSFRLLLKVWRSVISSLYARKSSDSFCLIIHTQCQRNKYLLTWCHILFLSSGLLLCFLNVLVFTFCFYLPFDVQRSSKMALNLQSRPTQSLFRKLRITVCILHISADIFMNVMYL